MTNTTLYQVFSVTRTRFVIANSSVMAKKKANKKQKTLIVVPADLVPMDIEEEITE